MSKHFDYLMNDEAANFFEKAAFQSAGIKPARPAPPVIEKTAAPVTGFEKVAARLDRDLSILKTAGSIGPSFGMYKRAGAYMDVIFSNTSLSPEEFREVFDKVAATAIETDLQECWNQLSSECPRSHHGWLEGEMAKIGFNLAAEATLDKEAFVAALGRGLAKGVAGLSRGRAVLSAAKAVGKAAPGRGVAAVKGGIGKLRAGAATKNIARLRGDLAKIPAGLGAGNAGIAARAARKSLGKQLGKAQKVEQAGLGAQRAAAKKLGIKSPMSASQQATVAKMDARKLKNAQQAKRVKAAKQPAKQVDEIAKARKLKASQEVKNVEQKTKRITQGTGTDGAVPKLKSVPSPSPGGTPKPVSPAQAEAAGAPQGIIEKLQKGGWNTLTGAEKLKAGGGAYLAHKIVSD